MGLGWGACPVSLGDAAPVADANDAVFPHCTLPTHLPKTSCVIPSAAGCSLIFFGTVMSWPDQSQLETQWFAMLILARK